VSLADAAICGIADSVAFRASTAPYLILDLDLRIRAANPAYQEATHHHLSEMVGESMFEVFPDNPATPEARSVERLGESFERALVSGGADRMGLQRYDVVAGRGAFVAKSWLPVNSPIRDPEGRTVGILHHVEDVTRLLVATTLERDLVAPEGAAAPPATGTRSWVAALQRDSLERRTRAQLLLHDSRQALERMSRRIDAGQQNEAQHRPHRPQRPHRG
jgi:hypothetical protein